MHERTRRFLKDAEVAELDADGTATEWIPILSRLDRQSADQDQHDTRQRPDGDNTEFFNPFRQGETILGAHLSVFGEARTSDRLAIRVGVFGNQRFGSAQGLDDVRPVLALVVGTPRSRLILGTLETVRRAYGIGPDRSGPHGLLPALQVETLAFERPWEAGLQWIVNTPQAVPSRQ